MITDAYGARLRTWERRNRERGEPCDEQRLMAAWARYFDMHPDLGYTTSIIHQRRHTLTAWSTC